MALNVLKHYGVLNRIGAGAVSIHLPVQINIYSRQEKNVIKGRILASCWLYENIMVAALCYTRDGKE